MRKFVLVLTEDEVRVSRSCLVLISDWAISERRDAAVSAFNKFTDVLRLVEKPATYPTWEA